MLKMSRHPQLLYLYLGAVFYYFRIILYANFASLLPFLCGVKVKTLDKNMYIFNNNKVYLFIPHMKKEKRTKINPTYVGYKAT